MYTKLKETFTAAAINKDEAKRKNFGE